MRIGYCSPFNPMQSGISDFSEELVLVLKDYVDVVVFSPVELSNQELLQQVECHLLSELDDDALRNSLDLIVYHVGNHEGNHGEIVEMLHKYPGVLELHEIGLHQLAAVQFLTKKGKEAYLWLVEHCHGARGLTIAKEFFDDTSKGEPWVNHPLDMCMNRHIIESARAVIVHSEMVKQMVLGIRDDMPIANILLHVTEMVDDADSFRRECREALDLDQKKLVFGSFGLATSAKRIIPTLEAVERFSQETEQDFLFVIVGEVQKELKLEEEVKARGLEGKVKITGFTSLEDFKLYMGACDFCLNLRYPTQGESSASLQRMMGMGKPAIVTDVGTFSDYPEDIVLKVRYDEHEVEDILAAMRTLTGSRKQFRQRSEKASAFARENCDLQKNAQKYCDFFSQVIHGSWSADFEDVMVGRLCELGLTDEEYLNHICPLWQEWKK